MPKIVDRFQDHKTGAFARRSLKMVAGSTLLIALGCWLHAECWRRLGAFKGADRNRAPHGRVDACAINPHRRKGDPGQ
jgi:hypothetical protein